MKLTKEFLQENSAFTSGNQSFPMALIMENQNKNSYWHMVRRLEEQNKITENSKNASLDLLATQEEKS